MVGGAAIVPPNRARSMAYKRRRRKRAAATLHPDAGRPTGAYVQSTYYVWPDDYDAAAGCVVRTLSEGEAGKGCAVVVICEVERE